MALGLEAFFPVTAKAGTLLYGKVIPPVGGDTLVHANQYVATTTRFRKR